MAVAKRKSARRPLKNPSAKTLRNKSATKVKKNNVKSIKSPSLGQLNQPCNKSQLTKMMCDLTGHPRKHIQDMMACLQTIITAHMKKQGPGEFTLPGILKMKLKYKPATKARKGINPFTGEPTTFKAKPARNVVKISALKKLKETIN